MMSRCRRPCAKQQEGKTRRPDRQPDVDSSSHWNKCTRLAHWFLKDEQRERQHVLFLAERGFGREELSGHASFALRSCRWRSPAVQYGDALLLRSCRRVWSGRTEHVAGLCERRHLLYI